jgi:hypothetical protein
LFGKLPAVSAASTDFLGHNQNDKTTPITRSSLSKPASKRTYTSIVNAKHRQDGVIGKPIFHIEPTCYVVDILHLVENVTK